MSSYEDSQIIDPEKIFLSKLIIKLDRVNDLIYFSFGTQYQILDGLDGIISLLDPDSKKALRNIISKIEQLQDTPSLISGDNLELKQIFKDLTDYLHPVYLQNLKRARPKIKTKGHL